jgi:large subunit ribosomal protein L17
MRHHYAGRKLKRTASHKKALLSNLASSLFEHKRLTTTVAKAKELRPFAEQLITRAKHAHLAEKNNAAQGTDVHNRRMVGRFIRNKAVLQELFDTIAPLVADRPGGYTRITKLGLRRGDKAMEAMIELVDWSNPTDGRSSQTKRKAKATPKKPKPAAAPKAAAPVAAAAPVVAEEVIDETPVMDAEAPATEAAEAPATDAPAADAPAADTADAPTE